MTTPPTIAFVHGAFADSSGWSDTLAALVRRGYPVIAVPNELRGLQADADQVRSVLATLDAPIVLVGHSYGGAVIGEAARGLDNVAALAFIAAYVLDEGEAIATVLDPTDFPGGLLGSDTTVLRAFSNPLAPGGQDGDLYIRETDFAKVFAADVPPDRSRLMCLEQRPLSLSAFTGTAGGDPAWKSLPCWYLIAEEDNAIPPAGQRWMAARAGATVDAIASSHAVMVSHPEAVTATVLAAAESLV
jgi:pimeloyl-ACP methyl ester carboxylesterase